MKLVNCEVFNQSCTELVYHHNMGYNKMWIERKTMDVDNLDLFNNSRKVNHPVYGVQYWVHFKSRPTDYPLIVPMNTYIKLCEMYEDCVDFI